MDIELILDSAEIAAPGLGETARRFLEAEARHLGVPLDSGSVMARRAEGEPELHIAGAADELLTHLVDSEESVAGEEHLDGAGAHRRAGDHDVGRTRGPTPL